MYRSSSHTQQFTIKIVTWTIFISKLTSTLFNDSTVQYSAIWMHDARIKPMLAENVTVCKLLLLSVF